MILETPTEIKEAIIEDPYKKTITKLPNTQIHKKIEDKNMEEGTTKPNVYIQYGSNKVNTLPNENKRESI